MQKISEDFLLVVNVFFKVIRTKRFEIECLPQKEEERRKIRFVNLDEVPVSYDLSPMKTYHKTGEKTITLKTSTAHMHNATVLLTITDKP